MFERTISIGSAGKTFSCTGWKIGWCIASAEICRCLAIGHQWDVFSVSSTSQLAIARSLITAELPYRGEPSYYQWLNKMYRSKRTRLANALRENGIVPIVRSFSLIAPPFPPLGCSLSCVLVVSDA